MAFISAPEPSLHWGPPSLRISHRSISWYSKPGLDLAFLVLLSDICRYCTNLFQAANFGYYCWMRGQDRRPPQFNFCSAEETTAKIWNGGLQTGRNGRSTYSTVIFHIRCSPTIGLNMRTNLGLPP